MLCKVKLHFLDKYFDVHYLRFSTIFEYAHVILKQIEVLNEFCYRESRLRSSSIQPQGIILNVANSFKFLILLVHENPFVAVVING